MAPALAVLLALCSCTSAARTTAPRPPTGAPATSAPAPVAAPPTTAAAVGTARAALLARVRPPSLPAFSLPTDLLTSSQDRRVADLLGVPYGLYQGIAVLDARCDAEGRASAADAGTARPAGSGHVDDGTHDITVHGDGTGVYDAPGLHVAVLGNGSGVYEGDGVRLQVQPGGAGTWVQGERRLTVRTDGSGSYDDGTVRLWVGQDGSGGYDDPTTHVTVDATGVEKVRGDPVVGAAAVEVVRARFPRFAPVPTIVRTDPVGTSCGTVVRLDADVLFELDSAAVRPEAHATLQRLVPLLGALHHPRTQVDGHTDDQGTAEHNQELSVRRAQAVVDDLVAGGVPSGRLVPVGHGESDPLQPERRPDGSADEAAQRADRRVELVLLDG